MAILNVYYINMRTTLQENLLQKLEGLVKRVDMMDTDSSSKYTVIKIHFGEPGDLAYLHPNYSKVLVDLIRSVNGRVLPMDCNILHVGRRKNTLNHLDAAYENGYNPLTTGCHVITADGLRSTDEALVPIDDGYVKETKTGRAIVDADIAISSTHSKGHEATGSDGILKNPGMGRGFRAGKMEIHNAGKPHVHTMTCIGCGSCKRNCAHEAVSVENHKAPIDTGKCVDCGRCIGACPVDAVCTTGDEASDISNMEIVKCSLVVLRDRPNFHVSLMADASPFCGCHGESGTPIVPSAGMFASLDSMALDVTYADAVNHQLMLAGSYLAEREHTHHDYFTNTHPDTSWETYTDHAAKLGPGNRGYDLIMT